MRCLVPFLIAAFACAALLAPAASAGPAAVTFLKAPKRSCGEIGPPDSDVGVYKIVTQKIKCSSARPIIRDWYYDPSQKDSGPAGWRCTVDTRGYELRSQCHRKGRSIAFSLYLA